MIMVGDFSSGARTAFVGWESDSWMASSVATKPSVMSSSAYICAVTDWKPMAGPPARISSSTPVLSPSASISVPVTTLFSASTT
jgi:hypothetical protein